MAAELDRLGQQTNDLTTQIRKLSHQLHPDVLEHVGLVAALESEVAEFGHNEQIKVEFKAEIKSEHDSSGRKCLSLSSGDRGHA